MNHQQSEEERAWLREVALTSPLLAYMLTRGYPLVPRAYSIELRWDSSASDQLLDGDTQKFNEKLYQMFWVQDVTYTVRRPLFNVGVFGAREQDEYCKLNPYVDVRIDAKGDTDYKFTDGFQPLENLCKTSGNPRAWASRNLVLNKNANLIVQAYNRRAFAELEVPYIVTLTFSGLELSGCKLPSWDYDEVVCKLRDEGIYPLPAARK